MTNIAHVPVMAEEVLTYLNVNPEGVYWDGTFGRGGHAKAILDALSPSGRLIASDRDQAAAEQAATFTDPRFDFHTGEMTAVLARLPDSIDGFLLDLGVSTPQLKDPVRGFSFRDDGPLDMRMDQSSPVTAADWINQSTEKEIADTIYQNGEERLSRRIARLICEARDLDKQWTTSKLADICTRAFPRKRFHRIHPATRTFQALRIAVNDELGQLRDTLPAALAKLNQKGRGLVISFHSLEDRIVKHCFKDHAKLGFRILTKRPLVPQEDECARNPASRSAKFRAIEREELS